MEKINLTPLISLFNEFFINIYKSKINELLLVYPKRKSVIIDYSDLEKFDPTLADKLIHEPDITIEAAETAIREMKLTLPGAIEEFTPHVRFSNLPSSDILIEQLSSKNLNEIVSFKGVVTRRAELMNRVKIAVYTCQVCDSEMRTLVTKNFTPPKRCESCKKFALKQSEEKSRFVDIQRAEVQELLERVRGGAPAAHIELWLEDDIVNTVSPGDNIELVGILRLRPPLKMRQKQELIYTRYLEVIHVRSLKRDFEEIEITKEDERRIIELSKNPNIEELIMKSIAPAIYGHEEVKKALSLQLFGGTRGKKIPGGLPIRDDVHILLIGDPGIAKCTDGNTKIMLADGSIENIRDIVESTLNKNGTHKVEDGVYAISNRDLFSLNLDGRIEESKATYFWKLKAPEFLYEIETFTGKSVRVTQEHPFFVLSNSLILSKPAKDLKDGEFIATPRYINIPGKIQKLQSIKRGMTNANIVQLPEILTPRLARLLGYLIGDGYVRRTKSIPQIIMKSPQEVVKEFIKAYFDCKASIGKEGIIIVSVNKDLLDDIRLLLLRFGILSQLNQTYSRTTNTNNHKRTIYYRVSILGENAQKYMKIISFTSQEKIRKLKSIFSNKKFNTNIDIIPNIKFILKETRKALGLTQFHCGIDRTIYQHLEREDRNPSRATLKAIVTAFKKSLAAQILFNDEKFAIASRNIRVLELLSYSHIFWDKVKAIRKVKIKEEWVYDLQVEPTHNFIANGMIVHNTRFLQHVSELAPKSIYVSGKSVSSAGLTVTAEKDEFGEGGWVLKAGALVLASGGNISIDEFDKINEEDRAAMHEAMEVQQISVAKAGIVAKFKSKTALLAAANPKYGRFDQTRNLAEQFDVAPTLMSRFDLIFPIVDILDEEKDSKLAQHILSAHIGKPIQEEGERPIDRDLLRKYIAYARRYISPQITTGAVEKIKDFYVELRRMSKDVGSVAITPRYLEGLVRLSEANAKLRLNQLAEERDAEVAISLMRYVMKQVMTDKATGLFDVDTVTTGKPKSERDKLQKIDVILEIIHTHLKKEDSAEIEAVVSDAISYGMDEQTARRIIAELLRRGEIYEREHGHVRSVSER